MIPEPAEGFHRADGTLLVEEVPTAELAARYGTPLYVYSARALRERYRYLAAVLAAEWAPLEPLVAYSVKACSSLGVLAILAREGAAFDVVSGGEILRVVRAGGDPHRVIFAGVGKADCELELALDARVFQVNVESESELRRLDAAARRCGVRARAAIRVNPEVDPKTHPHLATGKRASKFGVAVGEALGILGSRRSLANVVISGLHVHVGSMLRDPALYVAALERLTPLVSTFADGELETLDIGGGFAIPVDGDPGLSPAVLARAVAPQLRAIGARPIVEPGRWIAAPAGILLTQVLDRKPSSIRPIVVVDAGMNDLLRPALYEARHPIEPVSPPSDEPASEVDVVGPVCESGDTLARQVFLSGAWPGAVLAIRDAGAYGFSMASNYNSRPRPAEVVVDGSRVHRIRARESFDDLWRGETLTPPP